jgi:hypothetical protein
VTGVLEIVVEALLDCLMFLELSDDEAVNPDDAVRMMEWWRTCSAISLRPTGCT